MKSVQDSFITQYIFDISFESMVQTLSSSSAGEWRFGAGRGVDAVAVFAVGTGIGGGLVINGQLHIA